MLDIIINSLWLIFPAYCANVSPVLLKGRRPIDFGRNFVDGRRILGDGKTIRGFLGGTFFGFLAGLILVFAQNFLHIPHLIFGHTYLTAFLLSFGALLGDLIGSFIKRRFNLERGAEAPILDQLDFLIISLALLSIVSPIPLSWAIFLLILTPIVHRESNVLGYILKLKKVPW